MFIPAVFIPAVFTPAMTGISRVRAGFVGVLTAC